MKRKIAFVFPGQGAQYPKMGKDFFDSFDVAKKTFEEADDLLSYKISNIIFQGPPDVLAMTINSQLGIYINSIAILRCLNQCFPDLSVSVCAGLSLGEYTALCASKKISFQDALLLVQKRAQYMNDACEKTSGVMAAVIGLSSQEVEKCFSEYKFHNVWAANFNTPGQVVISGTKEGVEIASKVLKGKGAKKIILLQVQGAFHSGLMQTAQDRLAPKIIAADLLNSEIDFVMNVPGDYVSSLELVKKFLIEQVTHSIKWQHSVEAMDRENVDLFIEIGCGKTLTGMNKKIGVKATTVSIEKISDFEQLDQLFSIAR